MNTVLYKRVLANNKQWAETVSRHEPKFFETLSQGQSPDFLYIGCSDSRVSAELLMGVSPGEVFVHRNIANMVINTDMSVMSVIEYAVVHLHVKEILVCGHYGCGGIKAALESQDLGLLNPWLRNIRDVYRLHETELDIIFDEEQRLRRLVELNVQEQCMNVIKTACVQRSYLTNKYPRVHGLVLDFKTGLLKDLELDFDSMLRKVQKLYRLAGESVSIGS